MGLAWKGLEKRTPLARTPLMPRLFIRPALAFAACLMALASTSPAAAMSRIKDIVDVEGIRDNMLVGYGLVVGLNGTGDTLNQAIFTRESLIGMLERLGVNARDNSLRTSNVAAVMVTATLPPFSRQGGRIDVTVATLGNSKSLLGGTLLVTPLLGADGEVYAVGQGSVATGGVAAKGQDDGVAKHFQLEIRRNRGVRIELELGQVRRHERARVEV
jgi:flagellar P-ring protein precursor FlgI